MIGKNSSNCIAFAIAKEICKKIDNGDITLGQVAHTPQELAKQYNVDEPAATEALKLLCKCGLVNRCDETPRYADNRTTLLSEISALCSFSKKATPAEIDRFRFIIEYSVIEQVINNIKPNDIMLLKTFSSRMSGASRVHEYAVHNLDFHTTIVKLSENNLAIALYSVLTGFMCGQDMSKKTVEEVSISNTKHNLLIKAVAGRDVNEAKKALENHYGLKMEITYNSF